MTWICLHEIKIEKKSHIPFPTDEVEIATTCWSVRLNSIGIVLLVESAMLEKNECKIVIEI